MIQQDAETCPVAVEIVCEGETIAWGVHKNLVCNERLCCAKHACVEGINGNGGNELIRLGLSKDARDLAAGEPILTAIDLCAPEPLGNTRLTNPRRGIDLRAGFKSPNNKVEQLQIRKKTSNTRHQKETPQRRNSVSHRLKIAYYRCFGLPG